MNDAQINEARAITGQFTPDAEIKTVELFGRGRINDTFLVTTERGERFVLQRVNPIFAPSVLLDIDVLTRAMKQRGFATPELVSTKKGELGVIENNECWRMLTFIPGRTVEDGITEEGARNAMALIGRFHNAFAEDAYVFHHARKGFHDTPYIMKALREAAREYAGTKKHEVLAELAENILRQHAETPRAWIHLPRRIVHGDPKLNNVRFAEHSDEAVALLDLDTLGRHSVVIDVADAARSWCNRADEGDEGRAHFDLDIFRAMMEGYSETARFLTGKECEAIPCAITQIALELAARFATDAYRESYFKLDHERYPDLFTQNLAKARTQFALYRDIRKKLSDIANLAMHRHSTRSHLVL